MILRSLILPQLSLLCLAGCPADEAPPRPDTAATSAALAPAAEPLCRVLASGLALPAEVRETSGLARGRRDTTRFWTHNDAGGEPVLFALDEQGRLAGQVRVEGAGVTDWEDLEAGACAAGSCLYVADIGDNDGQREDVRVYVVPEPGAEATSVRPLSEIRARYPDRPQDAEALFALPSGELYLVSKGRHAPVALYRFPKSAGAGETGTLERVRQLLPQAERREEMVTAATASPDGKWVAVRTYRTLYLYPARALVQGEPVEPRVMDLGGLKEAQGEAIVLADDGRLWLTSEAEKKKELPRMARLECRL